ncbi:uncharacterized protein LOC134777828 [Penaeus indicus]|uniref:uncharacterized protein LOC134777828 n=1 Tax=Penaeus indicus TaxID=29960 RepID=UPI00300C5151
MVVKFASCLTIISSLTLTSCFPANGPALLARRLPDNDFHLAILQIQDKRYHTLTYKRHLEISQISDVYKSRSVEKSDKVVTKNPDEVDAYVTDGNPNDEVYFFWTWEAIVIVSIPVLCISSLLIISFLTRTRLGVRLYRFLTSKHEFDLEISRRISHHLEQPHVFRSAEATTDQGEPRNGGENGECVAVELRYNSSSESFVPYYDSLESRDSFDSQYSSEGSRPDDYVGSNRSTRKQRCAGRKSSTSSEASNVIYHNTSRRGSQESQRSLPKLWGDRRKGSNDSQMSLDSQLSVHRRGSTESQRSIMKLWYARRQGSTDSQISNDTQSIASRRGSSDSQRRHIGTDRHSSMDSSYGSIDSQGSKEGLDNVGTGARTKRRDSPRHLEASLQEIATYSQGRARSLDLGEERRSPRTLSLIHEEPPV